MKSCSSTIVFISLVASLFFVTLVTVLSSNPLPEKDHSLALLVTDNG